MKALITGGTGFFGRHLVPHLQRHGADVTIINTKNCDLTDRTNLLQFKNQKFDRIYHLAAWTKAGDFCLHHRGEQWIVNQQINTNTLWFWHEFQPHAVMIAIGTSCSYPPESELREGNYMLSAPDPHFHTYAMTKRMLYEGLLALRHQYGYEFRHLIPSTVFGPLFDPEDSHFIFDLIKKIVAGRYQGRKVQLWGEGTQVRELLFIGDALRLIDLATDHCPNESLNLGSGIGYSIREYAEMICEIVGYDPGNIEYDTTRFSGMSKKVFDTTKVDKLFSLKFTQFQVGLRQTIDYYLSLPGIRS